MTPASCGTPGLAGLPPQEVLPDLRGVYASVRYQESVEGLSRLLLRRVEGVLNLLFLRLCEDAGFVVDGVSALGQGNRRSASQHG